MNRKPIILALVCAAILAAVAVLYFVFDARQPATPGRPVWIPAEAPTRPAGRRA